MSVWTDYMISDDRGLPVAVASFAVVAILGTVADARARGVSTRSPFRHQAHSGYMGHATQSNVSCEALTLCGGLIIRWAIAAAVLMIALLVVAQAQRLSQSEKSDGPPKVDWSVFLPDGDGRSDVAISCSGCHDLCQVITQKKSRANWSGTVQKMVSAYQAPVDKDDFPSVVGYLAKNFGNDNPIDQLPININTCPSEALSRLPGLRMEVAKAIVESRKADGPFVSIEDLQRVKGIDAAEVERIKGYVKTKD